MAKQGRDIDQWLKETGKILKKASNTGGLMISGWNTGKKLREASNPGDY
jgi:hypothetical protein